MLKDYFWSLTFITFILFAYTALVIFKKSPEAKDLNRNSASVKQQEPNYAPTSPKITQ